MNIYVYIPEKNQAGERLQELIEALALETRPEVFKTFESFIDKLRRPKLDETIAVLLADSRKVLTDLISIRGLLLDIHNILILPDGEEETIAKGHYLYPLYLTHANSRFTDVVAVLKNMLSNLNLSDNQTKRNKKKDGCTN